MTREEFEKWHEKTNSVMLGHRYFNNLTFFYSRMPDNWIAVFKVRNGEYIPGTQAFNEDYADAYCNQFEPIPVPVNILC